MSHPEGHDTKRDGTMRRGCTPGVAREPDRIVALLRDRLLAARHGEADVLWTLAELTDDLRERAP